ncbi:MAG: DUF3857 and transglutaminase domain-containing protein [Candidatus Omnitrophica bacterium]|nr:DUF3857 and transglutaminase domain-containing protein [Candidatus Omnitrophota bacterium]
MMRLIRAVVIVVAGVLLFGWVCAEEEQKELSFEDRHKDKQAIYLLYDVDVELKEDWSYTTKIHKKLKIIKEQAKELGEIPISYEKGRQTVKGIKAYTITPDGKKYRYSKIQDFSVYESYHMYSDARLKVITLPQVNIGSVLEYEATIISKRSLIKNAFWYALNLAFSLPTEETNYRVTVPKKFNIQYKEFNLKHKPLITENGSKITYSWHLKEIDDYKEDEDFLPPPDLDSVEDAVEFSSIKNWSDISDWYYSLIKKNLKISSEIEQAAREAIKGLEGDRDKVRAVLEYLQDNFRYVSMSFGDNALEPHPTTEVFGNKYGDCKDISLLCMAMLKVIGIKSSMALFNDEFSITDPQYDPPMPSLFDHVLLLVEDLGVGELYIDPLLDGFDIGEFPMGYQGAYTFIITDDGGRFGRFPIFDEGRYHIKGELISNINADGSCLQEMTNQWDLDLSIRTRKMFENMSEEDREKFLHMIDASITSGGEVLESSMLHLEEKYGPISTYIKFKKGDCFPITDGMIIIDRGGFERGSEFTRKERENDIFYAFNSLTDMTIEYKVPEGFRVSHLPKDLSLDIGFLNFKRQYKREKDQVAIIEKVRYIRKRLPKEDYNKVKDFYDKLPQETSQRIVLKQKKPIAEEIKEFFLRFRK